MLMVISVPHSLPHLHHQRTRQKRRERVPPLAATHPAGTPTSFPHPQRSNPHPDRAAARLKQELAATSAAGALDADSIGSEATAE